MNVMIIYSIFPIKIEYIKTYYIIINNMNDFYFRVNSNNKSIEIFYGPICSILYFPNLQLNDNNDMMNFVNFVVSVRDDHTSEFDFSTNNTVHKFSYDHVTQILKLANHANDSSITSVYIMNDNIRIMIYQELSKFLGYNWGNNQNIIFNN